MTPPPTGEALDLAPILARADAATEGPWRLQTAACDHPDADNHSAIKGGGALVVACAEDADATFIAAARTDIPALVAEVTRLRTALEHAIATGCAAVAEALREGEEARAALTKAKADAADAEMAAAIGEAVIAAMRGEEVSDFMQSFGPVMEAQAVLHFSNLYAADREALWKVVGDACAYLGVTDDSEADWPKLPQYAKDAAEMRSRLAALESAPTFADGVRAMKAVALAAVSTCCESAYADIERIDPSTVKP